MQCVILAAGKGMRLRPLTDDRPKPMVALLGRPILEHIIERLPGDITEMIVVIGYRGGHIRDHFGESWRGVPIRYVEQPEQRGTADALFCARSYIRDRFLVVTADDLLDTESLEQGLSHDYCVFASRHTHPERFGVLEVDANSNLVSIEEKPERPKSTLVNTASMVLSPGVFDVPLEKNARVGEYLIPDLLTQLLQRTCIRVAEAKEWLTITSAEDVPIVERLLQQKSI